MCQVPVAKVKAPNLSHRIRSLITPAVCQVGGDARENVIFVVVGQGGVTAGGR